MIPKIIHQTWKTKDIPENWKNAVESCKAVHADYTHMLWTDDTMERFMQTEYPDSLNLYKSYKHDIQRCDAFRYFVLYKYGGIYIDMDTVCKKKIDGLLKHGIVFSKSTNVSTSFTNSFYMVEPRNPFIKHCIDNLSAHKDSAWYLGKHFHIMNSTGPFYLSKMIDEYGLNNIPNHRVLTQEEYSGDCNVCNEAVCKGGVYFKHIKGQTWNSFDSLFYNYILCNYKIILCALLVAFSMYVLRKGHKKIMKMK